MQRVVALACAAFALGMFAYPLAAQQTPAQQSIPEAPQPAPEAEPLPPPPPFPPMPSARPSHRWVDVGDHHARRARHHAAPTRHHAKRTQQRRTHAHHRPTHKVRAMHFSRRTIRSCHGMNYRQIMRHSSCRALMSQELATAAQRHLHHATHHHGRAAHGPRHHHAVRRSKR
jgi:hypothetical protein